MSASRDEDGQDERTVRREGAPMPVRGLRARALDVAGDPFAEGDELTVGSSEGNDLILADPTVSRFHLELRRAHGGVMVRDLGSTNGTRIGPALVREAEVRVPPGTVLELGSSKIRVEDATSYVAKGAGPSRLGALEGRSTAMRTVTSTLLKIAPSDVSVLVVGESGTGKELAARALHDASARAEQPFVTVDCGAIAPSLFASELFGHEKGAFTGADRRHAGAFERAAGGTLFLDEVGELGPELQAALLGALQRRRIRRVGGTVDLAVDVRVVSATHRDLRAMVNSGAFRLDLFFRLATVRVTMPPLRERPDDVPVLIASILREVGHDDAEAPLFDPPTLAEMARHGWPGNVRELRNVVLGAIALGEAPRLDDGLLSSTGGHDPFAPLLTRDYTSAKRALLDEFERRWLGALLKRTGGNVRAASREGKIERKHLIELLRRHDLTPSSD